MMIPSHRHDLVDLSALTQAIRETRPLDPGDDTDAGIWIAFKAQLSAWQAVIDHLGYRLRRELPDFNPLLFHRACGDDRKLTASGDVEADHGALS